MGVVWCQPYTATCTPQQDSCVANEISKRHFHTYVIDSHFSENRFFSFYSIEIIQYTSGHIGLIPDPLTLYALVGLQRQTRMGAGMVMGLWVQGW